MSLLIAEPHAGVREIGEGFSVLLPYDAPWPCAPCANATHLAFACLQSRECLCIARGDYRLEGRMPAAPGVVELQLSPCSRYVYQLSAEADCVHTRQRETGELLFSAPTGVFPRMMRLSPGGGRLLVAGGAVAEAYVISAPELELKRTIETAHPCIGADFWAHGVALACAAQGETMQTCVYTLRADGETPRLSTMLPGLPGGFCVCSDGLRALVSTSEEMALLWLSTGKIVWKRSEGAQAMRLCCRGVHALASDTTDGKAYLFRLDRPWEHLTFGMGNGAQACFV